MVGKTILIVDDEAPIREMIAVALEMAGYECLEAENTQQAHAVIVDRKPDLILLDWMLPGTSGIELARRLKRDELTVDIPIIMLTAKGEEDNKIQGLEVGADDYITKPFSPRELVARLKAVLRRTGPGDSEAPIEVGGLLLDPISHRVTIDGKPAEMGPTEYRLLQFFMTHQERAYTRGQLLDQVWGGNVYVEERTVDVHIRRLRKALGEVYENLVQTVRGTGYRFSTRSCPRARPPGGRSRFPWTVRDGPPLDRMQSVVNQDWRGALIRHLLLVLAASLVLGVVSGHYGWALALGLALYLGWTLWQLLRLHQWLRNHQPDEPPPDSYGLWGEVFDNIYHLQRRNQRARGRLQAVIDRIQESTAALRDAVIMLDSDGNLEWWNLAAENLLGLKTPQDGGQPVSNLIRHPRFKEYFDQEDYREPLEIPSPINERLRLQFHITLYGNREHLMLVRDVTRVHQLEQMRKDFVANVSHELRTPLTVIAGYLETLLDNVEDVNPRWLRALQQMQQQAGRMQNLLNDLLLLAKLEATEYPGDNKPVAVDALLASIRNDAQALSAGRNHRISLDATPAVQLKGSEAELRSAFSNLVFNAVKYTPDEGEIRIRWWADEQGAHLSVQDTGIGVDPKHLPRLTERFYRVDSSRASNTGGTGLGLAIVKHVLIRHRARLEISSVPGKGSTFTCHFAPAQVAEAERKASK